MAQPQTQLQATRANTLDRMLNDIDLPDLSNGYFSYPVDDFFVDYVDALGQRGLQSSGSLAMSTAPGKENEKASLPYRRSSRLIQPRSALLMGKSHRRG